MRVALTHYECKPEGGGVYMVYAKNQGSWLSRLRLWQWLWWAIVTPVSWLPARGVVGQT
jgi:hypothetical protein